MNFQISPNLNKELKKIKSHDKQLVQKLEKQLALFQENHLHPSLRVHKLTGKLENIWSMSVDRSNRALYVLEDGEAYFFDIGTHDQVYKK